MEDNDQFILHNQYHSCWWLGHTRSQGISNYGADVILLEYSNFSTRQIRWLVTESGCHIKLEQLERLRSEIPRCPMITPTNDSHQIQSQNKTSQSYKFWKRHRMRDGQMDRQSETNIPPTTLLLYKKYDIEIHVIINIKKFSRWIDGLVQDCSNSIANALELLQSCTKPSKCFNSSPSHAIYMHQRTGSALVWRQAITWTNVGLLSIGLLGTNFSEIQIGILSFSCKKIHLILPAAKMVAILSRGRWVQKHTSGSSGGT